MQKHPPARRSLTVLALRRTSRAADYAIGADLSFLKQAEDRGTVFKDGGQAKPGLADLQGPRLQLDSPAALSHARRNCRTTCHTRSRWRSRRGAWASSSCSTYHYSDTWADPGKQFIPAAWKGMSHEELVRAVFDYTRDTIRRFARRACCPTWCRSATR